MADEQVPKEQEPIEVTLEERGKRALEEVRTIMDEIDDLNSGGWLSDESFALSEALIRSSEELTITRGASPEELFGLGSLRQALRSLASSSLLVSEEMEAIRRLADFRPTNKEDEEVTEDEVSFDPESNGEGRIIQMRVRKTHDIN
jgi:hypothetical protein